MSFEKPLHAALASPRGRVLSFGPGRWHVLFANRQRPLLMPAGTYRFQEQCIPFFIGGRLKALYARAMLKMNALVPGAGLLPEFRLPRGKGGLLPCDLPIPQPAQSAIQIGTPGPYQKASMLLMSRRGEGLALAKIAMVPSADRLVTLEARWLRKLEGMRALAGQVPKLLTLGRAFNGRSYLVTTLAPSTRTTNSFTSAHIKFLETLGRSRLDTMCFKTSPCLDYLERTFAYLQPCLAPEAMEELQAALHDCRASLGDWSGPFVIAQGDFAPWNIRVHRQRVFVFDWEYARAGANPLADVLNYFLIQKAVSGRGIPGRVLVRVMRRAHEVAEQVYPEWTWRPREVSALTLAYLLEIILHYSQSVAQLDLQHPVIESYWRLVEQRWEWMAP